MSKNIAYQTDAISAYFGANRRRWDQFYASERTVIESVARRRDGVLGRVMDVGCACGGLGAALALRYELSSYTGIDINSQAIAFAQSAGDIDVPHTFICGDITQDETLAGTEFDTVFNLSCADWNVDFDGILSSSWSHVAPGGVMIISLRLTDGPSVRDMERSFQYIHYGDPATLSSDAERAAYVVLNVSDALGDLSRLNPARITGYGYWGPPSASARTPYKKLLFSVFAVEKPAGAQAVSHTELELTLPPDIW